MDKEDEMTSAAAGGAAVIITDEEASNKAEAGYQAKTMQMETAIMNLEVTAPEAPDEEVNNKEDASNKEEAIEEKVAMMNSEAKVPDEKARIKAEALKLEVAMMGSEAKVPDEEARNKAEALKMEVVMMGSEAKEVTNKEEASKEKEAIKKELALMNSITDASPGPDDSALASPTIQPFPGQPRESESVPGAHAHGGRTMFARFARFASPTAPEGQTQEREQAQAPAQDPGASGLAVARPVDEEAAQPNSQGLQEAQPEVNEVEPSQQKRSTALMRQFGLMSCMVLLLVVVIVVPSVMLKGDKNSNESSTGQGVDQPAENSTHVAPLTPEEQLQDILPDITLETIQEDSTSPQAQAYEWVLDDLVHLQNQNLSYSQARIPQRYALATLYFSTNGDDWLSNKHWLDHNVHECYWFSTELFWDHLGRSYASYNYTTPCELPPHNKTDLSAVEQGQNEEYRHLWLKENNLMGQFPREIGLMMTSLYSLEFYLNSLSGTIPTQLGLLTALRDMAMKFNKFTGTIPSQLGLLSSTLHGLRFCCTAKEGGQLTGSIPSELGQLTLLYNLILDDNYLTGTIPSELQNLSNLALIYLFNNQLSGTLPTYWANNQTTMPLMEEFMVQNNTFTGSLPTEMGLWSSLLYLWLHDNDFSGAVPSELGMLANLTALHLSENQVSGLIPSQLGQLTGLKSVALYSNQLTGSVPTQLGLLENMNRLALNSNSLTGTIPSEFGMLQFPHSDLSSEFHGSHKGLLLDNNQLSGTIPALSTGLTTLNVTNNPLLSGTVPSSLCGIESLSFDCGVLLCGCECSCNASI